MQCVGKQVGIGSAENDNILDGMLHGIRIKLDECLENVNMWSDVRLEACAAACDEEVLKVRKAKLSDVAEDMLLGHIDSYRAEFHRVLRATQEDNLWQGIGVKIILDTVQQHVTMKLKTFGEEMFPLQYKRTYLV
jgi:hypothetical protein